MSTSTMMREPEVEDVEFKNKKTLDLLAHCRRAIGEWQSIQPFQSCLLNVESNLLMKGVVDIRHEMMDTNTKPTVLENWNVSSAELSGNTVIGSLRCTRVSVCEMYRCETNSRNTASNIAEMMSVKSFVDTDLNDADVESFWINRIRNKLALGGMSNGQKDTLYWAMVFNMGRSSGIIPGILGSVEDLKKRGFDSWLLPNGVTVPIDALQMRLLEVTPLHKYVFRVQLYYQTGGTICGDIVFPHFAVDERWANRTLGYCIRRLDDKLGFVLTHQVLEVDLGEGRKYIVDPAGMQFSYRGPKGSLIPHGEYEEWAKNFPGVVGQTMTTSKHPWNFPTLMDEVREKGNGPFRYIERLKANLEKYGERKICNYCGRCEGEHQVAPKKDMRYTFKAMALSACGRCKKVGYCDQVCQKLDWKNHKQNCTN